MFPFYSLRSTFWDCTSGLMNILPDLDFGEWPQGAIVWNQYRKFNHRIGCWCQILQNAHGQQVRQLHFVYSKTSHKILLVTKSRRLRYLPCHFLQNKQIIIYGSQLSDYLIPLSLHLWKAVFSNNNIAVF